MTTSAKYYVEVMQSGEGASVSACGWNLSTHINEFDNTSLIHKTPSNTGFEKYKVNTDAYVTEIKKRKI